MPGPPLTVEIEERGNANVVYLTGDIDASSIGNFQAIVEPLCGGPQASIILDCTALTYVNSTGIGVLFAMDRTCRAQGGKLLLHTVRPKILNVIRVLGLEELLTVVGTREEALALVEPS